MDRNHALLLFAHSALWYVYIAQRGHEVIVCHMDITHGALEYRFPVGWDVGKLTFPTLDFKPPFNSRVAQRLAC